MIKEHETTLNRELATTNNEVNYIKENYTKTETFNQEVTEIKDNMFTQEDRENIEKSLESKRDKNTKMIKK